MKNTREMVTDMLCAILDDGRPSHLVIAGALNGSDYSKQDRDFIKKLCQGTIERRITLDLLLGRVSSVPVGKMKPVIRNVLRSALYQLMYMNVPDSAACNEAVKIVKKRGFGRLSGFVNGVLRSFIRQKDELTDFSRVEDEAERLELMYSMPGWLTDFLLETYSMEQVREAYEHFLSDNLTSVRCNLSRISCVKLKKALEEHGIKVTPGRYLERCFRISGYDSLEGIEEFSDGMFCVQDESSALAGEAAGICGGEKILDLCAAPGGKSLHAADLLLKAGKGGSVLSCDVSERKKSLIDSGISRCGFDNITSLVNDAASFRPDFNEAFDIVIADVPCSGLGIIGKKPDIKYNMTRERLDELTGLQQSILRNAAAYVRPGGKLVFSTCTINPKENTGNVSFLTEKCGLRTRPVSFRLANGETECHEEGFVQILPSEGMDGFFIALLEKPCGGK